jgi:mono/diheme cytochrome c family protein
MQFSGTLWNHVPRMLHTMRARGLEPPKITPDEMEKLVEYVFYLSFLDGAGDVERGRRLFAERSCARCHQVGGRGGNVGPRLDELAPHASALFMAQALWSHGPQMGAKVAELGLEWPRLGPGDLRDIIAFLRGKDAAPPSLDQAAAECGNPRLGKTLFELRGCAGCHALGGDEPKIGPDLGKPRWHDFADMAGALWNHGPAMWAATRERGAPLATVGDGEMADVMAYLFYVQFTAPGGDVARGERLFGDKTCVDCHVAGGAKTDPHRDLAASEAVRSSIDWASAMWNHAPAMERTVQETGLAWPRFEAGEMRDLVAFLRARRAAERRGEP